MNEERNRGRRSNVRMALILLSIVLAFFVGIIILRMIE
jgi:hypothetical protein